MRRQGAPPPKGEPPKGEGDPATITSYYQVILRSAPCCTAPLLLRRKCVCKQVQGYLLIPFISHILNMCPRHRYNRPETHKVVHGLPLFFIPSQPCKVTYTTGVIVLLTLHLLHIVPFTHPSILKHCH